MQDRDDRQQPSDPVLRPPRGGLRVPLSLDEYQAPVRHAVNEDRSTAAQAARFVREGLVREGELGERAV